MVLFNTKGIAESLLSNLSFAFGPKLIQTLGIALIPVLLTMGDLGHFTQYRNTLLLLVNLSNPGLGTVGLKYVNGKDNDIYSIGAIRGPVLITTFILWVLVLIIFLYNDGMDRLPESYRGDWLLNTIASITVVLSSLTIFYNGALQASGDYREIRKRTMLLTIGNCILYGSLLFLSLRLFIYLYLSNIVYTYFVSKIKLEDVVKRKWDFNIIRKEMLPLYVAGLFVFPVKWLIESDLYFSEGGSENLGILSILLLIQTGMITLSKALNPVFITSHLHTNSTSLLRFIDRQGTWLVTALLLFSCIELVCFVDESLLQYYPMMILSSSATVCIVYSDRLFRLSMAEKTAVIYSSWNITWGVVVTACLLLNQAVDIDISYVLKFYLFGYVGSILITGMLRLVYMRSRQQIVDSIPLLLLCFGVLTENSIVLSLILLVLGLLLSYVYESYFDKN